MNSITSDQATFGQLSLDSKSLQPVQPLAESVRARVQLRVPKAYHGVPIISNLVSSYGLTVNINGALLTASSQEDGWFDLNLQGETDGIIEALLGLVDIGVDIWLGFAAEDHF